MEVCFRKVRTIELPAAVDARRRGPRRMDAVVDPDTMRIVGKKVVWIGSDAPCVPVGRSLESLAQTLEVIDSRYISRYMKPSRSQRRGMDVGDRLLVPLDKA